MKKNLGPPGSEGDESLGVKKTFQFKFNGPEVEDGSISVHDFAESAAAVGSLIEESNRILNGRVAAARVRLTADAFQEGSFDALLELSLTWTEFAKHSLGISKVVTSQELLEILGIWVKAEADTGGLFGLLKWLNGSRPREIRSNGSEATVVAAGGSSVTVDQRTITIMNTPDTMREVGKILRPLGHPGMDEIEFSNPEEGASTRLTKEDREKVRQIAAQIANEERVREYEGRYRLVSVHFEGSYRWRLADETNKSITARIEDAEFLERVHGGESFRAGTTILARMRISVSFNAKGEPRSEYAVIRVLEVQRPAQQVAFPPSSNPNDTGSD